MSYCKDEGKDKVIFVTQEDHESPMKDEIIRILDEDPTDQPEGLILPSGDINWNCPCLGGMPSGPCGPEFREAFSCFHYSEAEPKGSDCLEKFRDMQECMTGYPELYPPKDEESEGVTEEGEAEGDTEGGGVDDDPTGNSSSVQEENSSNEQKRDNDASKRQEEKAS